MKTKNVAMSIMAATLIGTVTIEATTAQVRSARTRNAAKAAALTSTPETTEARQDAHQENQDTRKNRREDANPNQKAAAYNITKTKHQQKVTRQANAAAAVKSK